VADPTRERGLTLLGSAATGWPEPGCRCRECLAATGAGGTRATSALAVGVLTITDGAVSEAGADPVTVQAGQAFERGRVRVIGLPATTGVALVIGSAWGTALWAPGTGPLPQATLEALRGAALDVAALGAGRAPHAEPRHLEPPLTLAHTVAQLRRVDALADGCDVVAVGLDHLAGVSAAARLAGWGARIAPDDAPLGRGHGVRRAPPALRTLVLGPARSGKSATAEALLASDPEVEYLPTGPAATPDDADWAARVAGHRQRRPAWWVTLEGAELADRLGHDGPPLLVDSLGTWVAGALDRCGAWDDVAGWRQTFEAEVDTVVHAWWQARRRVVAVGEETGWGVIPSSPAGRRFRDELGALTRRLAAQSERVLLVVAGRTLELGEAVLGV
jgi:adenosylcobinamide kinase/adenosylcobinamide-phosphate guanylyltransferase